MPSRDHIDWWGSPEAARRQLDKLPEPEASQPDQEPEPEASQPFDAEAVEQKLLTELWLAIPSAEELLTRAMPCLRSRVDREPSSTQLTIEHGSTIRVMLDLVAIMIETAFKEVGERKIKRFLDKQGIPTVRLDEL